MNYMPQKKNLNTNERYSNRPETRFMCRIDTTTRTGGGYGYINPDAIGPVNDR